MIQVCMYIEIIVKKTNNHQNFTAHMMGLRNCLNESLKVTKIRFCFII